MRPKSLILLALALGCGLVASIGISQVMERNRGETKELETEAIFVAKRDLRDGEPLTIQVLEMEQWPKSKIPPGAILKQEEWEGQWAKMPILKSEPILKGKIADKTAWVSKQIPPGYCTVTVAVDAVTAGGGLIKPRDFVDVLAVFTKNQSNGVNETGVRTILRKIEVFAVDNQYRRGDNNEEGAVGKVVSLLVTPQQAKQATLAADVAKIRLILKPPDSVAESDKDDGSLTISDLGKTDGKSSATDVVSIPTPPTTTVAPTTPAPLTPKTGILDWLNGSDRPVPDANVADLNKQKPWTIMLLEGNQVREVVFNDAGSMPASRKMFEPNPPANPATDNHP